MGKLGIKVWTAGICFMTIALMTGCSLFSHITGESVGENISGVEQTLEKIRVGYHPNFGGASVAVIGIEKGFFKEEGLDAELVQFTSGPPSVAALQAGDIDFSFLGHGAYGLVIDGQADVLAVDCLSNAEEIMARVDSGIETVEQLEGKKLATPFDTSGENFLDTALRYYGMDVSSLHLVNMDVAGCVTALEKGKVDAVSVWAPYSDEIRKRMSEDKVITLVDCMDFKDTFVLPMSWVATDDYLGKNRQTAVKFLRAVYRCMDYRQQHLDETARLVADRLNMNYEDIIKDTDSGMWLTSAETDTLLENQTIRKWYEDQRNFFLEKEVFDHPVPLDDYMRLDLMEEALN